MPNWANSYIEVEGKPKDVENFCKLFIFDDEVKIGEKYFARSFVHQTWKDFKKEYLTEKVKVRNIGFSVDFAWSCWSCMFEGYPDDIEECVTLEWAIKKYNVKVKIEAEECGEGFEEHITTKNGKPIYSSQDMPEHKCIFCKNKQLIPSNSNLDDEECYECEKYGFGDELTKIVKEKIEIIKKQK